MIRSIGLCATVLLLVFTIACSRLGGINGEELTTQPTETVEAVVSTISPEPEATPTPTVEPTPIPPHVVMEDQSLDESGELVAREVTLPVPGWLVIYRSMDGKPDEIIGSVSLAAGAHKDVRVIVNTDLATQQLFARVHIDVGAEGVFEYPGGDGPFPDDPGAEFTVELLLPQPQIEVAAQDVAEDGLITVAHVELLEPAWILIHTDDDGEIGPVIGGVLLEEGTYENVPLAIDWRRATPTLHAVLHEDDGAAGVVDFPDGDMPILVNGSPIVATFAATYPPDIVVYDQPMIDGTVTIERTISQGPGWLVIYNEIDGQPGLIIGSAPLTDGLNEVISVKLTQSAVTEQLFARLHEDTEPGNAFNFPNQDPAVRYNNRLPNAAGFRVGNNALAFMRDQKLIDDAVSVDVIVSPVEGWAAVYADDDGAPGELLGSVWFSAGVNRNVAIELDPVPVESSTLYLALYQDLGKPKIFEPGLDLPLSNEDNRPIRVPFDLYLPLR